MMKNLARKFKKGAASFYIVAFSTLILVIVASSFAVAVVSEVMRTSNDDLSQSAYDAALAGIEEAKLAYANYRSCVEKGYTYTGELSSGDNVTCEDIIYWMHPDHANCDMVAKILGRIGKNEPGHEVIVTETTGTAANNMNQAYTCVKIETTLPDYRASLSSSNAYKVVKVELEDKNIAKDLKYVKVSWYSRKTDSVDILNWTNLISTSGVGWRAAFPPLGAGTTTAASPPTLAVELIQTATGGFTMAELNGTTTASGATDRATVYLVPTNNSEAAKVNFGKIDAGGWTHGTNTYVGAYDGTKNVLSKGQVASTNNLYKNLPFAVYCPENGSSDFVCSALLELPDTIGGGRNSDTFMFLVSIPYETPDTDFSLEFCTGLNSCTRGEYTATDKVANLSGIQVTIDSTGRANDLYRRVEVRMEQTDASFSYPLDALELTPKGDGTRSELKKEMSVTRESSTYTDLPSFGTVTAGMYNVNIYPKVDGTVYPGGLEGYTFNVYVNNELRVSNRRTYNIRVPEGQTVRVELNSAEGHTMVNGVISTTIDKNTTITPEWEPAYYTVDLTTVIDGRTFNDGYIGFNYNVWLGSRLVGDSVRDYTNARVKYGTKIIVEPINQASGCTGGRVEQVIRGNTTVTARWGDSCLPHLTVTSRIDGVNGARDGFTFSVYLGNSGTPVASNVTSFSQDVAAGTSVRVAVNPVRGYTAKQSSIVVNRVDGNVTVRPEWQVNYYTVDINSIVDGETYDQGKDGFTFDVYLNGYKEANGVKDYYNERVMHGTKVEVRPRSVTGYVADTVSGTVDAGNLYLSPNWHKGEYYVDVNMIVNGTKYATGVYGLSFDVYADDVLVANSVTDFYRTYPYGTKIRVKAQAKNGFTLSHADETKTVKGYLEFTPTWTGSTQAVYAVDVNEVIDDVSYSTGLNGNFTFNVYMNGTLVASNVQDFNMGAVKSTRARVVANDTAHYSVISGKDETKVVNGATEFRPTWGKNTTTITYNGNGADSGSTEAQYITGGDTVSLRRSGFTKVGYTFAGWNTVANGSGTSYAAAGSYKAPEVYNNQITLYAQWTPNATITVAYNKNGGSGTMSSQTLLSGQTIWVKANEFTRSGYAFIGWATSSSGSVVYQPGDSYAPTASSATTKTLYAKWRQNATVTIFYDRNGGTGSMTKSTGTSGTAMTVKSNEFTRIGYNFAGWNTKSDGSGESWSAGTFTPNYTSNKTIYLYAQWTFVGRYMQDFTVNDCQSLASSEDYYVFDRRDMQRYTVRYANSQCWMASDLKIFTSAGQDTGTITSTDSNFSSVTTWKLNATTEDSYTQAEGYARYYNFCALSAGTACYSTAYYQSQDICPKNWRMPDGSELQGVMNNRNVFSVDNGTTYKGESWWTTSTAPGYANADGSILQYIVRRTDDDANNPFVFNPGYGWGWGGYFKYGIMAIRCVHK